MVSVDRSSSCPFNPMLQTLSYERFNTRVKFVHSCLILINSNTLKNPGEVIHPVAPNGDASSEIFEEVSIEENKKPTDDEKTDEIETIEDQEEEEPKPKPKKKRDSGYTKSLQEAAVNLKIADNQRQRRVN